MEKKSSKPPKHCKTNLYKSCSFVDILSSLTFKLLISLSYQKKIGFIWHPVANISVYVDYNEKKKKELLITFSQPECWHRNTCKIQQLDDNTIQLSGKKKIYYGNCKEEYGSIKSDLHSFLFTLNSQFF